MKRIYISILVLLVTGFVRGDAGVSRAQDPLVVNPKSIALKLENLAYVFSRRLLPQALRKKLHSASRLCHLCHCGRKGPQSQC